MDYEKLLTHMSTLKVPARSKAWKLILSTKESFMDWFNSLPRTQEQQIKAAWPQLFQAVQNARLAAAIRSNGIYVPPVVTPSAADLIQVEVV